MAETELKFDEQKVCTKLAEDYLNSETEFCSIGLKEVQNKDQYEVDEYNNKIYYVDFDYDRPKLMNETEISDVSEKYLALVHKIEQNAELFCQLEFLLRNIPMNDTKDIDLKLIMQSLVYEGSCIDTIRIRTRHYVCFGKDTPLFHLGLFAYKNTGTCFTIVCSKETVAVGTLFLDLCQDVGLGNDVALAVVNKENFKRRAAEQALRGGCVGVVAARCDVDSAVDALLAATTRYPWKLSRVLVQDAAMERFTRALEWKKRAAPESTLELAPAAGSNAVPVEGFRSVREALALLAATEPAPLAAAVWASDAAEAHELALGARAALVWLGAHGRFAGPVQASAALYCRLALHPQPSAPHDLLQQIVAWRGLTPLARLERLRKAIRLYDRPSTRTGLTGSGTGLRDPGTVSVDGGLCIVLRTPADCAVITPDDVEHSLPRFLNYVVDGGAVLVDNCCEKTVAFIRIIQLLTDAGIPIGYTTLDTRTRTSSLYKLKAIWMNYGTIFAN